MILNDPYLTVRQLALLPDISIGSVHTLLLTKLGLVCVLVGSVFTFIAT